MKRHVLILMIISVTAYGQTDSTQAPEYGWKHSIVSGLTLTQVAFFDWVQGGENALAYTFGLEGKSVQDLEQTNWLTEYKFAFGQTRLGDQGLRKTDDKIDVGTVLTYKLGVYVNPYGAVTFKSQFAKGFKYDAAGNRTAVSKFFDPAYITQSAGVGYQPLPEFRTRFGAALREILTQDFNGYADGEKTKVDGGLESITDVELKLDENVLLKSKLELFAPFETLDEIVVRNDNSIVAKVNKYIAVNLNVQIINEAKVSPKTQVKEALSIGISYTLL